MKVTNINYKSSQELDKKLNLKEIDVQKTFIQVFSGFKKKDEIIQICNIIKDKQSDIKFIGTTTAGEIHNGNIGSESITISVMEFEHTSFINNHFDNEMNFDLGVDIASSLFQNDTKAVILFMEGLLNNGNDVLDGISSINKAIPIAGGMAGDNGAFAKTFVFDQNGVYENGAVAVSLNSDVLNVLTKYQLNWQGIGKYMTITKAEKNRLYEIDGIPATDIYRKYLGDKIGDGLPHSAIEFPLLKIEDDGLEVCRTFVHKFDEDGSLLTIGNLEVGDKVRLAFGNVDLILNSVSHDIEHYNFFQPEAIFTYSCASRITFLQSDVVRELKPLNDIAPIAGFFTYGEIYHSHNKNSLLNISLTILGLSELRKEAKTHATKVEDTKEKNFIVGKHFMVLDALSHLSNTVIDELEESIKEVEAQKILLETLFVSAPDAITLLHNGKWVDCNPATVKMFGAKSKDDFLSKLPSEFSPKFQPDGQLSMEKVYDAVSKAFKMGSYQMEWEHIRLDNGEIFTCEVILAPMMIKKEAHIYGIIRDITERKALEKEVQIHSINLEKAKLKIESMYEKTRDSIEYASLIQGALIPDNQIFYNNFSDYFSLWQPKDIVGGDIYLIEELRDKDECLLMVIDCTGHGVPGAFATMFVKAIERQVIAKINNDKNIDVSPAWILSYFNKTMKKLLKQESSDSISNAGFDGGIIYYNKRDKILKFAGAETPLFYIEDEELKTIKGSRQSVGYKKSDINFEFKEHTINVKEGMQFYCSTDGYLDQNGGEKSFPFGKKRFTNKIKDIYTEPLADQKELLLNALSEYQGDEDRNDDVTVVAFKVGV